MTSTPTRPAEIAGVPAGSDLDSFVHALHDDIYRDGIALVRGGLPVAWADRLNEDITREFMRALSVPGGTAARGWNRYYYEPYVELTPGWLDLATHPVVLALCREMFGDDWRLLEWGADLPLPGAEDQWPHRDFAMNEVTLKERRLTSIAINANCIDVESNNAPFRVARGTHFDDGAAFIGGDEPGDQGMFPLDEARERYAGMMETLLGSRGNFSIRSALMIHGGSASETNRSRIRPTIVMSAVSPEDEKWVATPEELVARGDNHIPRIRLSEAYRDRIRAEHPDLFAHLQYEVVSKTADDLPPYHTWHTLEGLIMGSDPMAGRVRS
jgi:hypothetical protein